MQYRRLEVLGTFKDPSNSPSSGPSLSPVSSPPGASGGGTSVGSALLTNRPSGPRGVPGAGVPGAARELCVPGELFQDSQAARRVPGGGVTVHAKQTPPLARAGRRVSAGEEDFLDPTP